MPAQPNRTTHSVRTNAATACSTPKSITTALRRSPSRCFSAASRFAFCSAARVAHFWTRFRRGWRCGENYVYEATARFAPRQFCDGQRSELVAHDRPNAFPHIMERTRVYVGARVRPKHAAFKKRLSFEASATARTEVRSAGARGCNRAAGRGARGGFRGQRRLRDRQRTLVDRLPLGVAPLRLVESGQVIEGVVATSVGQGAFSRIARARS